MLLTDVVPTVETTQNGVSPISRSVVIAVCSSAGSMRYSASTPILRTLSCPMPSDSAPFSTEECACSEA